MQRLGLRAYNTHANQIQTCVVLNPRFCFGSGFH